MCWELLASEGTWIATVTQLREYLGPDATIVMSEQDGFIGYERAVRLDCLCLVEIEATVQANSLAGWKKQFGCSPLYPAEEVH